MKDLLYKQLIKALRWLSVKLDPWLHDVILHKNRK